MQTSALLISRRSAGTTLKLGKGTAGRPLRGARAGTGVGSGVGLAAGSEERRIKAGTDEAGVGLTTAGEEARGVRFGTATGLDIRGVVDAAGCEGGAVAGLKI